MDTLTIIKIAQLIIHPDEKKAENARLSGRFAALTTYPSINYIFFFYKNLKQFLRLRVW